MILNTPLRIWLAAGAFSVVAAAAVVTFTSPAVLADAHLPKLTATATPPAPVTSAEPAMLAPSVPPEQLKAHRLHGIASWYGKNFHGRKTASGERFDMFAMTACHNTLPFGSIVKVTNRTNKKSVIVRITDRGYLYPDHVIDLSFGAAEKLAMVKSGVASVDLEVLQLGKKIEGQ